MRIVVTTKVSQKVVDVAKGFNESLFVKLAPPYPKLDLKRFDGCEVGDKVIIDLKFGFSKQTWESNITESSLSNTVFRFVDIGKTLPFPLKKWTHEHLVEQIDNGSLITDHINYTTGFSILDIIIYPAMIAQFLYRKPVYKKVFA